MSDVLDSTAAGPAALRGSALRSVAYAVTVLLSLASAPLLVRHLGVADFGRYITVVALMNLVAGVTEAGLDAVALREYATLRGTRRRRAMASLMTIRLALTVTGVLVGVGFALVADYDRAMVIGAIGAGLGVVLVGVQTLLMVPLQAELRFGLISVAEVLRQVLTVGVIVALVLGGAGLGLVLWNTVPAGVLILLLLAWMARGRFPFALSARWAEIWPLVRDTLPYTVAVAFNIVYFRVTILIMSLRADHLETGYYATSFRVIEVLLTVPRLVIGAAYPILTRSVLNDPDRFANAMRRVLELSLVFGAWLSLNLVVGSAVVIEILAGDRAEPAVAVLRLQSLTLLAASLSIAASYALLAARRHRPMLVANGLGLVTSAGVTFMLVPSTGAHGAAAATLAAETLVAVALVVTLLRDRPVLRPGVAGAPAILGAGGLAVAAGLAPGLPVAAGVLLANVVFALGLALTGRFPREVGEMVAGYRERRAGA